MQEKVYLAGPITGYPERNLAEFIKWEQKLKETGAEVFNPRTSGASKLVDSGVLQGQAASRRCMEVDLTWICQNATSIFFMRGWEGSLGCRTEHALAVTLGLHIHYET
jgi:nucleoside 2-deoxyribosyltransferase